MLRWLASIPVWVAYAIAAGTPALEASTLLGFIIPGETAMIAAGALAGIGEASVWWVGVAGTLGAIVGDSVGYGVGRRWGERAMSGRLGRWLGRDRWRRTKRHFEKGGFGSIVLARFAPWLRSLAPGAAGAARMPYHRFVAANALGGVVWASACVGVGWAVGRSMSRLEKAHWIITGLGVAVAIAAGLWMWRKIGGRRPSAAAR